MPNWAGGAYIAEEVAPWIDSSGNLVAATGGRAVGTPAPGTPDKPAAGGGGGGAGGGGHARPHPMQPKHASGHSQPHLSGWREDQIDPSTPYGAPSKAAGQTGELLLAHSHAKAVPLFDQSGSDPPGLSKHERSLTTRQKVVIISMWAVAAADIKYSQGSDRMSGVENRTRPPSMPPAADCSSFATWVYYAAGAKDPNGRRYNGSGNTVTLWGNGRSRQGQQARPGDLVFFGSPSASDAHVGVYVGNGEVVSQGGPGRGPRLVPMSAEAAYEDRGYHGYRSYFP